MLLTLTITWTPEIVHLDGVECRRWIGRDAEGRRCDVYVHLVGTADLGLQIVFEKVLVAKDEPKEGG